MAASLVATAAFAAVYSSFAKLKDWMPDTAASDFLSSSSDVYVSPDDMVNALRVGTSDGIPMLAFDRSNPEAPKAPATDNRTRLVTFLRTLWVTTLGEKFPDRLDHMFKVGELEGSGKNRHIKWVYKRLSPYQRVFYYTPGADAKAGVAASGKDTIVMMGDCLNPCFDTGRPAPSDIMGSRDTATQQEKKDRSSDSDDSDDSSSDGGHRRQHHASGCGGGGTRNDRIDIVVHQGTPPSGQCAEIRPGVREYNAPLQSVDYNSYRRSCEGGYR